MYRSVLNRDVLSLIAGVEPVGFYPPANRQRTSQDPEGRTVFLLT